MRILFAMTFLFASVGNSFADECLDRFKAILTDQSDKGAFKTLAEQEIVGGMKSKNFFYQAKQGHWMTESIEPENLQWTLVHDNVMYSSSDKGFTWKKIRDMDSAANHAAALDALNANANTSRDAHCTQETIDGVVYEKVSGTYDTVSGFNAKNYHIYWIDFSNRAQNYFHQNLMLILFF